MIDCIVKNSETSIPNPHKLFMYSEERKRVQG